MDAPLKSMLSNRYFFTKGAKASDEYEQFWIRYKPTRVLRKHFKNYSKNQNLLYALVAGSCLAIYLAFGLFLLIVAVVLAGAAFLVFRGSNLLAPTHIALSEDGLQIHWLRNYCNIAGPLIGWDRLSHVSIAQMSSGFGSADHALEFNLLANGIPFRQRIKYVLLAPNMASGWFKGDRCAIRIKLDAIASSDDRKRLQMALKKFLPSYRIDATVTDELNLAIRVESYTDLWLDALSSSKRIREDMLEAGTHILGGKYEIVQHIGGGGQAVVYEALEKISAGNGDISQTKVVLKEFVLPAQAGVNVRKRVLGNIQREAQMLKKLHYENIVRFIDFFVDDQRAYVVLEYIDGVTLKKYVEEKGALTEQETVKLALQMGEILKNLHSSTPPLIHRDFTPDNLMINSNKILKLIDFNVAQHLEATNTNTVVGKHAYIPPEQFRGKATAQSDIYAMGGTIYYLLTGEEPEPITAASPQSLNSLISDELNAVVLKATAQNLSERFETWSSVKLALEKIANVRYPS